MNAMFVRRYSSPATLEFGEFEKPKPKAHQVLVEVHTSSINPLDYKMAAGQLKFLTGFRFPQVYGFDVCGRVVEVGSDARQFSIGDKVFGMLKQRHGGAFADYVAADEDDLLSGGNRLSDLELAALPLAGLSAYQSLFDLGELCEGQKVLINGASGGVGHLAVQLAKAAGAFVVGVCGTQNIDFVRSLGADDVRDYKAEVPFQNDQKFDVIFDVASTLNFEKIKPFLNKSGCYVATLPSVGLAKSLVSSFFSNGPRAKLLLVHTSRSNLKKIFDLAEQKKLSPHIAKTFQLSELAKGFAMVEKTSFPGKLGVQVI